MTYNVFDGMLSLALSQSQSIYCAVICCCFHIDNNNNSSNDASFPVTSFHFADNTTDYTLPVLIMPTLHTSHLCLSRPII